LLPQPIATGVNMIVSKFVWVITDGPQYPRYRTPIVAPEPSVEWVVRAVHSTGGRISTHMLLWAPQRDSVLRT
jgi:hypothetical protein